MAKWRWVGVSVDAGVPIGAIPPDVVPAARCPRPAESVPRESTHQTASYTQGGAPHTRPPP